MKRTYLVRVERIVRSQQTVEVVAEDENEAADLAGDLAGEDDWEQRDEDFEVLEVEEEMEGMGEE